MSKRILLTGASGFLGQAVLRQLVEKNDISVVATSRKRPDVEGKFSYVSADLVSDDLTELLANVDEVVHCSGLAHQFGHSAAEATIGFDRVNRVATMRLLDAAVRAEVKHFVHVSSVSIYGDGVELKDETASAGPSSSYGESKWKAEQAVRLVSGSSAMKRTILRLATLYGPDDPGNVGRLLKLISRGRFLSIGRGGNRKTLIHRDDAAMACVTALQRNRGELCETYNVCGTIASMNEIVSCLEDSLGKSRLPFYVPAKLARCTAAAVSIVPRLKRIQSTIDKWLRDDLYDGSKFEAHTGFKAEVELRAGLREQVYRFKQVEAELKPVVFRMRGGVAGWSKREQKIKRVLDIGMAVTAGSLAIVPALGIAAIIRLTSRGPILYWSQRVGRNNELFWMPKFRSMYLETPEVATHLLSDSTRWITPIGRFLRKTSLDELPQLWCILKGEMSFVGPRPALHNQDDLIRLRTSAEVHRLAPGLTGWAQVNGRDELSIAEKVALDVEYQKRHSIGFDIMIAWRTLFNVLLAKGIRQAGQSEDCKAA